MFMPTKWQFILISKCNICIQVWIFNHNIYLSLSFSVLHTDIMSCQCPLTQWEARREIFPLDSTDPGVTHLIKLGSIYILPGTKHSHRTWPSLLEVCPRKQLSANENALNTGSIIYLREMYWFKHIYFSTIGHQLHNYHPSLVGAGQQRTCTSKYTSGKQYGD